MKTDEQVTYADPAPPRGMRTLFRGIDRIERAGNRLPHPFWLFGILAVLLGFASWAMSLLDVSVTLPESGKSAAVKSLFSVEGIRFAAESALGNFSEFPPLAVILVMVLGVSVAERSGLLETLLRTTIVRLPARWVTFSVAFSSMAAHIMSDSAYFVMMPLGALAFRSVGRSPVLGIIVAYVSVGAGFNASPLVTPSEATRAAMTTAAAQIVDQSHVVTAVAFYFFSAASSLLLAIVITLAVEFVVARREEFARDVAEHVDDADPSGHAGPSDHVALSGEAGREEGADRSAGFGVTDAERRGMRRAGVVALLYAGVLTASVLTPSSPFLGKGGSIVQSVLIEQISLFIAVLFTIVGIVYGRSVGTVKRASDVPGLMAEGVQQTAPVIVLFFAVSQFLAYFEWTGIGSVITVEGADLLRSLDAPHLAILLAIILAVSVLNMLITSGTAQWAVLAPVLVPMVMYLNLPPEAATVAFMIGDSCTNVVTPMSAYFVLALGFVQRYRKNAGIGTLLSYTLPIAVVMLLAWTAFFMAWYALGIPLGLGMVSLH